MTINRRQPITLSTGRALDILGDIIGIDAKGGVFYGYDGSFPGVDPDLYETDEMLTPQELGELADLMITRWLAFKRERGVAPATDKDALQAAADDVRTVCRAHGVVLVGTCIPEGIFGEITIGKWPMVAREWPNADRMMQNTVKAHEHTQFYVAGIGDTPNAKTPGQP